MKIFGYRRPRDFTTVENLDNFLKVANESGVDYSVNEEYAKLIYELTGIEIPYYKKLSRKDIVEGSIMMAIGGDGTLLEAVHRMRGVPMPMLGINMGRLGFLTGISPQDLAESLENIKKNNYSLERRSMIIVEGDFGTDVEFPCALNEFTIHRHNASMVEVTVHVDGELISVYRGDGMIVSTPTGSTAYSLSSGGPIVSPECACFVLTAIAPHNFTMRPLVLPDTSMIEMEISSRGEEVTVSIDNQSYVVQDGTRFVVKKSKFPTFLVHLQNISFYDTLRNKMMWGMDKRDPLG